MPTPPTVPSSTDAIVIGAGPNGLVAANLLADAGWDVLVFEAASQPGGAVRTAELTLPGFHHDLFSAFYPLAAASPVIRSFGLDDYGLTWRRAPVVLAHPTSSGPTALLSMDEAETHASLEAFAVGDGDRWRSVMDPWSEVGEAVCGALFSPFPPVRSTLSLAARLGPTGLQNLARRALLPVRRLGEEEFAGAGARLLLAGLALHSDLLPEGVGSGFFGWLLAGLGEQVGFPVPEGGAQRLTDALVSRLVARGGRVVCDAPVDRITIRNGDATGVVVRGSRVSAGRAVLADTSPPALYRELVGVEHLSPRVLRALDRFEFGAATVKVDWALDDPIPWSDTMIGRAGTVHVGNSVDELSEYSYHLATGQLPSRPFLLIGQMTTTDPTRSPPGTETAWAYTHVPQHVRGDAADEFEAQWSEKSRELFADRMELRIEAHAPGFRDRIKARHIFAPPDFAAHNRNLVGGDTTGGTAQLHQQFIFRPIPGLGRAETPFGRLYLASASAHPGGGVHGAPGSNAARAALFHDRWSRRRSAAAGRLGLRAPRDSSG
jgi:phytoene dehydrogenase-like protein